MSGRPWSGLCLHLARKDWDYAQGWLLLAWAASASLGLALLVPLRGPLGDLGRLHPILVAVMVLLAQARLYQLDPLFGSTAFWPTRPVGRLPLLFTKAALSFVALVLPCSLIETVPVFLAVVDPPIRDVLLSFMGGVLWYSAFCAVAALPAVLTRGQGAMALACAASLFAGGFGYWFLNDRWPRVPPFTGADAPVDASRALVLALLAVGSSLVILVTVAWTRRRREALVLIGLAAVAAGAVDRTWRRNVLGALAPGLVRASDDRADRIEVRLLGRTRQGGQSTSGAGRPPFGVVYVATDFTVRGLADGLVLAQTGYETTALVPGQSQKFRADVQRPARLSDTWPSLVERALACRVPHVQPPWESNLAAEPTFEIFRSVLASPSDGWMNGLTAVRGRIFLSVLRPRVIARAPARPGAVLAVPAHRFRITAVSRGSLPLNMGMIRTSISPPVFGETFATPKGLLLVHNPGRNECLVTSGGSQIQVGFGLPLERFESTWSFDQGFTYGASHMSGLHQSWQWEAPADWLEDAELVLLGADEVRRLEVPFEWARLPQK